MKDVLEVSLSTRLVEGQFSAGLMQTPLYLQASWLHPREGEEKGRVRMIEAAGSTS